MIENLGLKNAFILVAVLGVGLWSMCIIMILFGKSIRRASAKTYWDIIERRGAVAH